MFGERSVLAHDVEEEREEEREAEEREAEEDVGLLAEAEASWGVLEPAHAISWEFVGVRRIPSDFVGVLEFVRVLENSSTPRSTHLVRCCRCRCCCCRGVPDERALHVERPVSELVDVEADCLDVLVQLQLERVLSAILAHEAERHLQREPRRTRMQVVRQPPAVI